MLPEWVARPAAARPVRRRGPVALRRFLIQSARFFEGAIFAERAARQRGLLQGVEARTKLLATVGLLVAASFLHHLLSLWVLGAFALAALMASRLSPRVILHRAVWAMPALFALVALPAMLSVFTPGPALLVLGHTPGGREVSITAPGAAGVALFISRVVVGMLLALSLTLTTPAQATFRAASSSATAVFVYTMAMMHRYLFLLLHAAQELHLARQARTIAPLTAGEQRRWAGGSIAFLFRRSRRLMEEVHLAMLARGYRGVPRTLAASRFGGGEAAWLLACAAIAAAALLLDHMLLRFMKW